MEASFSTAARNAADQVRNSNVPYAGELSRMIGLMHAAMRPGRVCRGREYKAWQENAIVAAKAALTEIGTCVAHGAI